MKPITCMFCKRMTKIYGVNAKKKIDGKTVTIKHGPVYFCASCKETFFSKELQDAFNYIKQNRLQERKIVFEYDELAERM